MDTKNSTSTKSSFLDVNVSWILMLVYIVYLGGMIFLQRSFYENSDFDLGDINYYAFIFSSFIGGLVLSLLFFNGGRIIGARIAGYNVLYTKILGFTIYHSVKKKAKYNILDTFSLEMKFNPKDDDTSKNSKAIIFAGWIAELVYALICLALFLIFSVNKKSTSATYFLGFIALFAMIYGLVILLYEVIPFRQDNPTDMFNLLSIKTKEDKEAFNIVCINRKRELTGEDFLVPEDGEFTSSYRVKALYYRYLSHLYKDEMEEAVNDLVVLQKNRKKFDDSDRYLISSESMYLHYIKEDIQGADKLYLTLKSEERSLIVKPLLLVDYRTSLLVLGYISSDKEQIKKIIKDYKDLIATLEQSDRVKKEEELFKNAYDSLRSHKADLNLEETF